MLPVRFAISNVVDHTQRLPGRMSLTQAALKQAIGICLRDAIGIHRALNQASSALQMGTEPLVT